MPQLSSYPHIFYPEPAVDSLASVYLYPGTGKPVPSHLALLAVSCGFELVKGFSEADLREHGPIHILLPQWSESEVVEALEHLPGLSKNDISGISDGARNLLFHFSFKPRISDEKTEEVDSDDEGELMICEAEYKSEGETHDAADEVPAEHSYSNVANEVPQPAQDSHSMFSNGQTYDPESFNFLDPGFATTIPERSRSEYMSSYKGFLVHANIRVGEHPTEAALMKYFDYLKFERKQMCTTIWSKFSRINSVHKSSSGRDLTNYKRLLSQLRSYEQDSSRNGRKTLTLDQIRRFLGSACPSSHFWIVRKALAVVTAYGALRLCDTRNINVEDLTATELGYLVNFKRTFSRGRVKRSQFLVPFDKEQHGSAECPGSVLELYLDKLRAQSLPGVRTGSSLSGPLFRTTLRNNLGFSTTAMGRNRLVLAAREVAAFLELENAETFTGFCLSSCGRRTPRTRQRRTDENDNKVNKRIPRPILPKLEVKEGGMMEVPLPSLVQRVKKEPEENYWASPSKIKAIWMDRFSSEDL